MEGGNIKILHVCYSDAVGGAARAAFRLHQAQCKKGVDSHMLVVVKHSDDPRVIAIPLLNRVLTMIASNLANRLLIKQKTTNPILHSLNFFRCGVGKIINNFDADIINIHWINGEMLSIGEIAAINKPIVWTLHDMWGFSGAEHYDDLSDPERYRQGYARKNRPNKSSGLDLDAWVYRRKLDLWKNKVFNIVTPSNWLGDCVKHSDLFSKQPVEVIPNCIDQTMYKPLDKKFARNTLNLPEDKQLILFGALTSTSDSRKGFHLLRSAIQQMVDKPQWNGGIELVIFGASDGDNEELLGLPCHYLGHINDDSSLALIYNAADVFVAPSMQDNLPNTLVEAVSCETLCVAFGVGGIPDIIKHKDNGYIADAYNIQDLLQGLEWALKNNYQLANVNTEKSKKVKHCFDIESVVNLYLNLYRQIK